MPKISVAIPVYNVEKYIARCLDSVINQTLQDIEIVVVNDKSPDKSMQTVKEYANKDSRIKIIEHDNNQGLMCARRTGYLNSSSEYVFFLDSDDALPSDALESLYDKALQSRSDIVAGILAYITPKGTEESSYPCSLKYGDNRKAVIKSTLLWEMTHTLCGKLFKYSLFEGKEYTTFEHYTNGEDGILYYQILNNVNKVSCIDKVVYLYYQNSESSTQAKYTNKTIRSILQFYNFRYQCVKQDESLKSVLDFATIRDLSILSGDGYKRKRINDLLNETSIPLRLNFKTIIRKCGFNEGIKNIMRVYVLSILRK